MEFFFTEIIDELGISGASISQNICQCWMKNRLNEAKLIISDQIVKYTILYNVNNKHADYNKGGFYRGKYRKLRSMWHTNIQ